MSRRFISSLASVVCILYTVYYMYIFIYLFLRDVSEEGDGGRFIFCLQARSAFAAVPVAT